MIKESNLDSDDGKYVAGGGNHYTFQFLVGVRGNTPTFFKCMSGYAVFRLGYGIGNAKYGYVDEYYDSKTGLSSYNKGYRKYGHNGFCFETELGATA